MTIYPDCWVILRQTAEGKPPRYRVLVTSYETYLTDEGWSGVVAVDVGADALMFHGESGSAYCCRRRAYGTTGYTQAIFDGLVETRKPRRGSVPHLDNPRQLCRIQRATSPDVIAVTGINGLLIGRATCLVWAVRRQRQS